MSWADQFNTYQEACDYYGCDGPAQFAAEIEYEKEQWAKFWEAEYGPWIEPIVQPLYNVGELIDDEIPF